MFKRDIGIGLALAITLVILLAVNLVGTTILRNVKLDLTEDKLYTLSGGSKQMLGKLDEEVRIKLFYSRRPAATSPVIKAYADRTMELLKQFAGSSKGKVTLEVIEPRPDTDEEEMAIKFGLQGLPTQSEMLYFGLVAQSETGAERSISFLDPSRESFLEYDIARLISALSHPEKQTIGIMSPLSVLGGGADNPMARFQNQPQAPPWAFTGELKQTYNVVNVGTTVDSIESNIDLLIVIHPKSLPKQTEYAIDQFVLRGGRAIILVDAQCDFESRTFQSPNPQDRFSQNFNSEMPDLFKAWGIEMAKDKVIADANIAAKVNMGGQGIDYIVYLMLRPENFNADDLISSNLEQMLMGTVGGLKVAADSPYTTTPLIETSDKAGELDSFRIKLLSMTPNPDLESLKREFVPGSKKVALAYRIAGKFKTAFPEGKPESMMPKDPSAPENPEEEKPEGEEAKEEQPHLTEAAEENAVIVISDVDFLTDDFAVDIQDFFGQRLVRARFDNLNFFNNAIENMTGSTDLISLRTRGKSARPFTTVDEIERVAGEEFKDEADRLQKELEDLQNKIRSLQSGQGQEGSKTILSDAQLAELEKFRDSQIETQRRLREVRRELRQDVESLGSRIKFINIALLPLLVILFSFVPGAWRSFRMRTQS